MSSVKERLGRKIRARREQAGLSQAQLAEAVGKTDTSIGLLERGKVWPEFDSLCEIARVLGVTVDDFFSDAKPSEDPTTDALFQMVRERDRQIAHLKAEIQNIKHDMATSAELNAYWQEKRESHRSEITQEGIESFLARLSAIENPEVRDRAISLVHSFLGMRGLLRLKPQKKIK